MELQCEEESLEHIACNIELGHSELDARPHLKGKAKGPHVTYYLTNVDRRRAKYHKVCKTLLSKALEAEICVGAHVEMELSHPEYRSHLYSEYRASHSLGYLTAQSWHAISTGTAPAQVGVSASSREENDCETNQQLKPPGRRPLILRFFTKRRQRTQKYNKSWAFLAKKAQNMELSTGGFVKLEITHPHYPTFSFHDWRAGTLSWCRSVQPEIPGMQDGSPSHDEGGSGSPDTELPDSNLKEPEAARHEQLVVQQRDDWADGFDVEEVYSASDDEPGPAQGAFLVEDDEEFGADTEESNEQSEERQLSIHWDNFHYSVTAAFDQLRQTDQLVDVVLCSEGRKVRAHKIMLYACSGFFRDLIMTSNCDQIEIVLNDVSFVNLQYVLEFIYTGSVNVAQSQLASFIKTAEMLQIRGLSGEEKQQQEVRSSPVIRSPPLSSSPAKKRRLSSDRAQSARSAGTQRSRSAGTQRSRGAGTQRSRETGTHRSRGAGTQRSRAGKSAVSVRSVARRGARTQPSVGVQNRPGGESVDRRGSGREAKSVGPAKVEVESVAGWRGAGNSGGLPCGRGRAAPGGSTPGDSRRRDSFRVGGSDGDTGGPPFGGLRLKITRLNAPYRSGSDLNGRLSGSSAESPQTNDAERESGNMSAGERSHEEEAAGRRVSARRRTVKRRWS